MTKKLYEESNISAIANAIRQKNGASSQYTVGQMPNAILAINPDPDLESLTVDQNGNYLPSSGKDGFSSVAVSVPNSYSVSDEGKVVKNGALSAQISRNISENGSYDTTENNEVIVSVSSGGGTPILQNKTFTQNGTYNADQGYDGFGSVTVNVSEGSSTLIGTDPPSNNIGNIGDYYIQELDLQTYMFGIAITAAGRDTDYGFKYWGARDIQIVFDDGNSNEVLLKDLSVKSCKYANGNSDFILQNGNIDGSTINYYEHSGLPGYYCIECEIPQTYLLKALKIYPRSDSSWHDYWRTFTFAQWASFKVPFGNDLVSEANLEYSDWTPNDYNVFNLGNIKPKMTKKVNVYRKYSDGWILIK